MQHSQGCQGDRLSSGHDSADLQPIIRDGHLAPHRAGATQGGNARCCRDAGVGRTAGVLAGGAEADVGGLIDIDIEELPAGLGPHQRQEVALRRDVRPGALDRNLLNDGGQPGLDVLHGLWRLEAHVDRGSRVRFYGVDRDADLDQTKLTVVPLS